MQKFKSLQLGSLPREMVALAGRVGLTAIDVGARGRINSDLRPIAPSVSWYCLEPDTDAPKDPEAEMWKGVQYLPKAAAASKETISINLYKQRGCSSKLEADREQAARFGRAQYYDEDGLITLEAEPLDDIISSDGEHPASFLKIDVQGMEVECFEGAKRLLSEELLGVRTEVSFLPLYKGQPLFSEVELALRRYGFQPMQWLERHDWRRTSRAKLPRHADGDLPYSRGQMIHADVIFLRAPEDLPTTTDAQIRQLIRLALIAMCYGLLDHAYACFARPGVLEYCQSTYGVDPKAAVRQASVRFAARSRAGHWLQRLAGKVSI